VTDLLLPRPFLKWAGGKTQLANDLVVRLPPSFKTFHEPFVGSGALFFRLYREKNIQRAYLSDLNRELIDAYLAVRDCVDDVIKWLSQFPHDKDFYYRLRSQDAWELSVAGRAARMIYLNKTGFNGLYRVNRQGKFNVPFGRYKSPKYLDEENLRAVSEALKNVDIECAPFESVLDRARAGDLVYFDPPYVPLSATANFTAYQANGFTLEDQKRLRDVCVELTRKKVYVILSNSDTRFIRDLYSKSHFAISEVLANRAINCNGAKRGKITELIVTDYPVERTIQLRLLEKRGRYITFGVSK